MTPDGSSVVEVVRFAASLTAVDVVAPLLDTFVVRFPAASYVSDSDTYCVPGRAGSDRVTVAARPSSLYVYDVTQPIESVTDANRPAGS